MAQAVNEVSVWEVHGADNEVDASERLFLNNPTMDGIAKLAPAFVGRDSLRYRLPSVKIIIRF